ncbi:T9SS C-terminal target domain-containing protein [Arenibacter aquaticus]|uniref:T9SS C-terminal target domain-containing protein n=1 Tax=Arenibacter aquaticus TaxID=2489054 RepID=A0A3S0IMI7_9FLAO|nr:S8 family serine peptidase [Arenibacter aquaticus]RTE53440.1 T9SS C-terminal target domain-containing protein [Arenibacter aquaticus]
MDRAAFILLFLCFIRAGAQEHAWVYFKDKIGVEEAIASPSSILTERSLTRKAKFNIPIDERDVPVNENYIASLKLQEGITVKAKSKWFNCVHVVGSLSNISALLELDFVARVWYANRSFNAKWDKEWNVISQSTNHRGKYLRQQEEFVYGQTGRQIRQLGLEQLHDNDFTGQGLLLAVLDSGFPNVDQMSVFYSLRSDGRLWGGYDFVDRSADIYRPNGSDHGTRVLSCMAAFVEGVYVGTAPDAEYVLFRTEDSATETPVEESYWVEAAERADSLGVDLINSSLGYSTFDDPNYNYRPSQMDGNSTFVSKGANIAMEKGILVVNSAGNSGDNQWGIITAPADANVFAVGAVDENGQYVDFSSKGPNATGQIKPDGMALGKAAVVVGPDDRLVRSNGTSFSSPILAGAIASFWQALPNKTNWEIMAMVRKYSSHNQSPNSQMGFGIPNFYSALLAEGVPMPNNEMEQWYLYPNPTTANLYLYLPNEFNTAIFSLFDAYGKRILERRITPTNLELSVGHLSNAMYIGQLNIDGDCQEFKIIKN